MKSLTPSYTKTKILFFFATTLNLLLINEIHSYLVLPLEYLPNENYKFLKNTDIKKEKEELMKQIYYKNLITKIEIGTPKKTQMMIINADSNEYFMDSLNPPASIQEECKISEYFQFGENIYFDEKSSSSYTEGECKTVNHKYYYYDEICYSREKINLNVKGNYITIDFPIKIIRNHDESVPGIIGLAINNSMSYNDRSFLSELKMENLIKDYYWFFDFSKFSPFEQKIKGNFIIGDLPHKIFPQKYSYEDYYMISSAREYSSWTISMNKIIIVNKTEEYHLSITQVTLFYDFYPVIGSKEFWRRIREVFLDQLVEEKKCFNGTFSQNLYSYNDLLFYYCDKSAQDTLYENLPQINFVSSNLEFTFQLTKEELFYTQGDYIYFMILFCPNLYSNNWIVGQIFMSKYHFVFHTDESIIGFYYKVNITDDEGKDDERKDEKDENNQTNKEESNFMTYVILFVLLFTFIGIIVGIIIGVKIWGKKRQKRANELTDDDYMYKSKENE